MPKAIGLVECKNYSAAVYAADVMLKSGNIILTGVQSSGQGSFITKIAGEADDVQIAVKKTTGSAKKSIINSFVIIDPHPQLAVLLPEVNTFNNGMFFSSPISSQKPENLISKSPVSLNAPKKFKEAVKEGSKKPQKNTSKPKNQIKKKQAAEVKAEPKVGNMYSLFGGDNETISRIRKEALGEKTKAPLTVYSSGEEGKVEHEEINEFVQVQDDNLNTLNVHMLRKLARSTNTFPIKGREISKANRGRLLELFKTISK